MKIVNARQILKKLSSSQIFFLKKEKSLHEFRHRYYNKD